MRVVALLPFKDEEWILPAYLSSVAPVVDEIVAIDDGSTDGSRRLVENAGGYVIANTDVVQAGWAEHSVRQTLLRVGRERGGTHFLGLDADEALTAPARTHLRDALTELAPGRKLAMRWLTLWKDRSRYRDGDGSVWDALVKDFAWADSGTDDHAYAFLGVARTPGPNVDSEWMTLPPARGAVLHYQFVPWQRTAVKQAWYRCSELIRTPERAFDINLMYAHGLEDPAASTRDVLADWTTGIVVPAGIEDLPAAWHLTAILGWFDEFGIEFFEPIDIWHIARLEEEFVVRMGRRPQPVLKIGLAEKINRVWAHWFASRS